jgi:hypothetical protein
LVHGLVKASLLNTTLHVSYKYSTIPPDKSISSAPPGSSQLQVQASKMSQQQQRPIQPHESKVGMTKPTRGGFSCRGLAWSMLLLSTMLLTFHRSLGVLAGYQLLVPLEHSQAAARLGDDDSRVLQMQLTQHQDDQAVITYQEILGLPTTTTTTKSNRTKHDEVKLKEANRRKQNALLHSDRTAVVWVCRYLDECGAARLKHLLMTVGAQQESNKLDVWILYNHRSIKQGTPEHQLSVKLMADLKKFAKAELGFQLRGAQQATTTLPLDGSRSGPGKSSFLKFVVQSQYGHAWHLEDDVWFTGHWSHVLAAKYAAHDVVATGGPVPNTWYYYIKQCSIKIPAWPEFLQPPQRMYMGLECSKIQKFMVRWPLVRVSLRFAEALQELSKAGAVIGHHEAIIAPMCHAYRYDCSWNELKPWTGHLVTAGWGKWTNSSAMTLERHGVETGNITDNKLYHPVKCSSYKQRVANLTQQLIY